MNINQYTKKDKIEFKHLINLDGVTDEEIAEIILTAREFKNMRIVHENSSLLLNKYALLITKPNLPHYGITFQIAVNELSGTPIISSVSGEILEDRIADENYVKTLSSYGFSIIIISTSKVDDYKVFANALSVPIVNATTKNGPCEALSVIMCISDTAPNFNENKITIVGDFSEGDNCLLKGLMKLGANVTLLTSKKGMPSDACLRYVSQYGDVVITDDKVKAIKNADFVCICSSDGVIHLTKDDFNVNPNCNIVSAIPIDYSLADKEVFSLANYSVVKQSENLLHISKAIIKLLAKN